MQHQHLIRTQHILEAFSKCFASMSFMESARVDRTGRRYDVNANRRINGYAIGFRRCNAEGRLSLHLIFRRSDLYPHRCALCRNTSSNLQRKSVKQLYFSKSPQLVKVSMYAGYLTVDACENKRTPCLIWNYFSHEKGCCKRSSYDQDRTSRQQCVDCYDGRSGESRAREKSESLCCDQSLQRHGWCRLVNMRPLLRQ